MIPDELILKLAEIRKALSYHELYEIVDDLDLVIARIRLTANHEQLKKVVQNLIAYTDDPHGDLFRDVVDLAHDALSANQSTETPCQP